MFHQKKITNKEYLYDKKKDATNFNLTYKFQHFVKSDGWIKEILVFLKEFNNFKFNETFKILLYF